MAYDPKKHHRRSIRLAGYNYSRPGAYFVTICTWNKQCLFGRVADEIMQLNALGHSAEDCWREIPTHFPQVALDKFIIMPNHIHGILMILGSDGEWQIGIDTDSPMWAKDDPPIGANDGPGMRANGRPCAGANDGACVGPDNGPGMRANDGPFVRATHASPLRSNADDPPHAPNVAGMANGPQRRSVAAIIGSHKSAASKRIHEVSAMRGTPLWHRNYYEHIIRSDLALSRIRQYIAENPQRWPWDPDNPQATSPDSPDFWRPCAGES